MVMKTQHMIRQRSYCGEDSVLLSSIAIALEVAHDLVFQSCVNSNNGSSTSLAIFSHFREFLFFCLLNNYNDMQKLFLFFSLTKL